MRKGIEAIQDQIERVKPRSYFPSIQEERQDRIDRDREQLEYYRQRQERERCTCPPWAVNGWDGPDHDCPTHGCSHVHDGRWP